MSHKHPTTYWISSSQHRISVPYDISDKYPEEHFNCNLSLIFDEGSDRHFSGFHFQIVVDEETTRQWHWQLSDVSEISACHAYRRPLKYCKATLEHLALPLCHVIARISRTRSDGFGRIYAPPSIEFQARESLQETDSIIHESVHLCPSGTRSETLILKFKDPHYLDRPIHFEHPATKKTKPASFSHREVFMLRVLPLPSHTGSAVNSLPLPLWGRIVKLAIELSTPEWAGSFLEYTYEQAPWYRLRNVFWEKIGGCHKALSSHPGQVAQNIIRQPELGRCITHFTLDNFVWASSGMMKEPTTTLAKLDDSIALFLQQVADDLRVCQLDARIFAENIHHKTRSIVQRLNNIEQLSVDLGGPGRLAEIDDIQKLIRGWRKLKHLALTGARPDWRRNEETSKVPAPPLYMLNSFKIKSSPLFGNQLLHFVPIATHKLRQAYLFRITDLSNAALRTFLYITCNTLTTLTIASCTILFSGEHEERAVDAIVPSMRKLRKLTVQEDLITSKTLSRGTSDAGAYDIDIYPCILRIWRISSMFAKRLPELVPSVLWDEMVVTYGRREFIQCESLEEAQQIAGNIGLPFRTIPQDDEVEP